MSIRLGCKSLLFPIKVTASRLAVFSHRPTHGKLCLFCHRSPVKLSVRERGVCAVAGVRRITVCGTTTFKVKVDMFEAVVLVPDSTPGAGKP